MRSRACAPCTVACRRRRRAQRWRKCCGATGLFPKT